MTVPFSVFWKSGVFLETGMPAEDFADTVTKETGTNIIYVTEGGRCKGSVNITKILHLLQMQKNLDKRKLVSL